MATRRRLALLTFSRVAVGRDNMGTACRTRRRRRGSANSRYFPHNGP